MILAALAGRPVVVPDAAEHVATGACVQAAAVLHGRRPEDVGASWGLGRGEVVEPDGDVDRYEIRARYRSNAG
jgi:sugar (pentulose or hexulose) kinase